MSPALLAALARPLVTTALLWRLDRRDGVALGYTSHDRDLWWGGLTYRSGPGGTVSAIAARSALDDDGITLSGPVRPDGISAADVAAGLWDDARVSVDIIDWSEPELGTIRLFDGQATGLGVRGGAVGRFELEAQRMLVLRGNQGPLRCAPMCRAELGDRRCTVDMAGREVFSVVVAVSAELVVIADALADAAPYVGGMLRILSGRAAGFDARITAIDGPAFRLDRSPGEDGAGARVRLREGCDKRFATCAARFGNTAAFDGEPHVPGRDAVVRYGAP